MSGRDARPGAGPPLLNAARSRVAYTPLHGVGLATLRRAFARAGFAEPAGPGRAGRADGAFPTLPKPNPEEPGVLDLLMAEGQGGAGPAAGQRPGRGPARRR